MAMRKFKLPGIQDLSKEQEDARALPKKGQHLIIGGPGTGKSVLALLRIRRLHEDKDNYVFLIYNHLLNQASQQLFEKDLNSKPWVGWFMSTFYSLTGMKVPLLPPPKNGGWQDIDWQMVLQIIHNQPLPSDQDFPYIVIDEGQDMPPEFYQALINLGYENFFVVADQNQQIVPDQNSTRQDIQNVLGIDTHDVIELRENYRNKYPIAKLAREFYTGDPASPPPQLPSFSGTTSKRPILFEYKNEFFEKVIERILKNADNFPSKLIGIIAPNNETRERYFYALLKSGVKLDNGPPNICTFKSGDKKEMGFDKGGIMVINAQSCKGLEFDIVFLADVNQHIYNTTNKDIVKRHFYVMVARAIDQVILLKESGRHCAIDAILPIDHVILERK